MNGTFSNFQKSSFESSRSRSARSGKSVSSSMSTVKLALISSSKLTLSSEAIDPGLPDLSFRTCSIGMLFWWHYDERLVFHFQTCVVTRLPVVICIDNRSHTLRLSVVRLHVHQPALYVVWLICRFLFNRYLGLLFIACSSFETAKKA